MPFELPAADSWIQLSSATFNSSYINTEGERYIIANGQKTLLVSRRVGDLIVKWPIRFAAFKSFLNTFTTKEISEVIMLFNFNIVYFLPDFA